MTEGFQQFHDHPFCFMTIPYDIQPADTVCLQESTYKNPLAKNKYILFPACFRLSL